MIYCTLLSNRGILKVTGPDRLSFLQGLVTNDVTKINAQTTIYSLLLTPQGKHSFDLLITESGEEWWIEADRDRLIELKKRLSLFKLKSNVTLEIDENKVIYCLWGENVTSAFNLSLTLGSTQQMHQRHVFVDPRLLEMGIRMVVSKDDVKEITQCDEMVFVDTEAYRAHRYKLGVPETNQELWVDKSIPLENGMDELNAIDWKKGCYMGQELTARTRYRGLVRKRLLPVTFKGHVSVSSPLMQNEQEVGAWRGTMENQGLALVRLEALGNPITCEGIEMTPQYPVWMKLPEPV